MPTNTEKPRYQSAEFLKSATELKHLPADKGFEVAFIGRSNAGKSSALNAITNIKGLARISKTPGRTQCINLFSIDNDRRLVDLPGYGYAKVPLTVKQRWEQSINEYLEHRECLRGLVLVMDIRHPLKELDQELIEWTINCNIPIHILLTKADKLKPREIRSTVKSVAEALSEHESLISIQAFSANQKEGVQDARDALDVWFSEDKPA